jgi:pyridoxamine 5'-phosphate oxidase
MPGGGGYDEAKQWPEKVPKFDEAKSDEERKLVEEALSNFALVVLEPFDVDYVEMAVMPNQRTRFVREGDEWKEEILVP